MLKHFCSQSLKEDNISIMIELGLFLLYWLTSVCSSYACYSVFINCWDILCVSVFIMYIIMCASMHVQDSLVLQKDTLTAFPVKMWFNKKIEAENWMNVFFGLMFFLKSDAHVVLIIDTEKVSNVTLFSICCHE